MKINTKIITLSGILIAISIVLVYLIHFPMLLPFLEYDPADIPIFIATFLMGTPIGLVIVVIVSLIQGLTVSSQSGIIGIVMHMFATGSYVLIAGLIYKHKKGAKGLIISMLAGVAFAVIAMTIWNMIFTPLFLGKSLKEVMPMLLPFIIPFNLIKFGINSMLAFILLKLVVKIKGKSIYKVNDKLTNRSNDKASNKINEKSVNKSNDKLINKVNDKSKKI